MARHLHLAPDARHLAVGSDQEGGPFDAHVFAAIEALFHPHAIGLQHPSFGIAAEHHLQAMLAGELLMALDAVLGDAEHGGSDRKSQRLHSSHYCATSMPPSV